MSWNAITVHVEAQTIGQELAKDAELFVAVIEEMNYQLYSKEDRQKVINNIVNEMFEQEATDALNFLSQIVEAFAHLKETSPDE